MVLTRRMETILKYLESDSTGRTETEEGASDYLDPVEVGRLYGKVHKALKATPDTEMEEHAKLKSYGEWVGRHWQTNLDKGEAKHRLEEIMTNDEDA